MEEKIVKIVAGKLRHYEGKPIKQEELESIRAAVYSATKTNKSASFSNVKKWIKAARSHMKKQEAEAKKSSKTAAKPSKHAKGAKHTAHHAPAAHVREQEIPVVSKKVEDSVNLIKDDVIPIPPMQLQEVSMAKPQVVFDKVYLQSIKYDIAGIRQTMERVSRQLDKLEKELESHGEDE
ncbi:MAG: hypothetical protein NTV88_06215 [Candidatus Micrarchaeota archaeon]|nr:hypothetical protein [Candidatus Micrarchaeota archaeon]